MILLLRTTLNKTSKSVAFYSGQGFRGILSYSPIMRTFKDISQNLSVLLGYHLNSPEPQIVMGFMKDFLMLVLLNSEQDNKENL